MPDMWMDVDSALSEVPINIVSLIDDTDFKTRETAIVYNQAGMDLVWNFVSTAGAFTQTAVVPTTGGDYDWTNQGDGMYSIEIPATGGIAINNDTEGFGWFTGICTGVLPWRGPTIGFRAAALNNALIDGGDNLDVNTVQLLGVAVTLSTGNKLDVNIEEISDDSTAAANLELDYDGTGFAKANSTMGTVSTLTGHTAQTGDNYAIVNNGTYGNAQLVRSSVPANTLDVSATGEAGLDFDNIKNATGPHTLANITVPITTNVSNQVTADVVAISGDSTAADNLELQYDTTGLTGDTFPATQAQIGNLSSSSAAISTVAESFTKAGAEPETNTYTSTFEEDLIYHIVEDDGGATDCYYQFDVGGNGVPVSITWWGYAQSILDTYTIWAYNYTTTSYQQIGTIAGSAGTTPQENEYVLTNAHVGTGVNLGKVRFRFLSANGTAFATDRILCNYAVVVQSVGYANGAIWVDTVNGTTGTTPFVNGTADNPTLTWAEALTLSSSLNIRKFNIVTGSSIVLSANSDYYIFDGDNYNLNLNNQSIDNCVITRATIVGTSSGSAHFVQCILTAISIAGGTIHECALTSTITLTGATTYFVDQCYSGVEGVATPILDFGAAVGNTNMSFRHYSGGIEIQNLGQSGTDNMSLEGWGQYVLNANCTGGTIAVRGHFKKTDNSGGAVTISDDANFKTSIISFGIAQGAGTGNNQIQLATSASSTDGAYDPALVFIVDGTGAGQTRLILEYAGATRTATVDRNWKVNPDTTSEYRIMAHPGREHVNEGLAQGAGVGNNQIQLNTLASSTNDAYNKQIIFLRSGIGEDQVRVVIDYVGATKIATVDRDWDTNPDSTTGYVMLPCPSDTVSISEILADVTGLNGDAMRGTDSANTVVPDPAGTAASLIGGLNDFDPANDDVAVVDLVNTTTTNTDMRGTDNAALASVCTNTRLSELDAANLPANIDTLLTRIVGTILSGNHNAQSGDAYARIGANGAGLTVLATAAALATMQTDVTAIKAKTDDQPSGIPRNVALNNFIVEMVLESDHITPGTGLTVTCQLSKDGAAYVNSTNTVTEISSGSYKINFTQAEMNYDIIAVKFTAPTADQKIVVIVTST